MFIEFDYKSLVLGTHTQTFQLKKHKQTNEMKLMHAYIINNVVKLVYVFFLLIFYDSMHVNVLLILLWCNSCSLYVCMYMLIHVHMCTFYKVINNKRKNNIRYSPFKLKR